MSNTNGAATATRRQTRRAQLRLRGALVDEQRGLDRCLGALGRLARDEPMDVPALASDFARIDRAEAQHAEARSAARRAQRRFDEEDGRRAVEEAARRL